MENNYPINQVMVRYNLENAHSMLYSYDELKRIGVDTDFIFQLLKVFEDERNFCADDFNRFSFDVIIDYIRKTHKFYLAKKLLEIEQSIEMLLLDYTDNHPLLIILHKFYSSYKENLTAHIAEEERWLLPYIAGLERSHVNGFNNVDLTLSDKSSSLQDFIDTHHDTEDDLLVVQKAILEYNPPATNETPYRILLSQLQVFEKDLAVHALIEDLVLIPRALELERALKMN